MNLFKRILPVLLLPVMICTNSLAKGFSDDAAPREELRENMERTQQLIEHVEEYLRTNDTYVAILARRGAGDPDTGVSDTDGLDLSGMAHCGFVIRNGFGRNAPYITFNLVRQKGAKMVDGKPYDLSELRVWTLPHFFIGAFEKDAIVFLPKKDVQLKLWNLLRANGQLEIISKERGSGSAKQNGTSQDHDTAKQHTIVDQIIANGAFPVMHNQEYNLLSDYVDSSTQNCNEHLLKTLVAFRDHWQPTKQGYDLEQMSPQAVAEMRAAAKRSIDMHYTPRQMVLSRTKSTFAFVQNIRFGESYTTAPTFFGMKLKKERFNVVSVDSFCDPANQDFLDWQDFKVFRENYSDKRGWFIEDRGRKFVKINRFTKRKNTIEEI